MKISHNWLKDYINTNLSPTEIGEILTNTGLEVESIEKFERIKGGLAGIVVGEVLTVVKHPDADRLNVTTVDVGEKDALQIVCGASNVATGQKVLVATVNATLYPIKGDSFKIKKSKIRGVESHGMICAEDELGLGDSHEGILVLEPHHKVGTSASLIYENYTDYFYEIGLTPNRADAMSHIGVARDLKAYLNFHQNLDLKILTPPISALTIAKGKSVNIQILNTDACPKYTGAVIENIKVEPSPTWLQNKLKAVGLKPINNIVDISNFVMLETGNPLHAFDLNQVNGSIVVRNAVENEELITLDGITRKLQSSNLVICNAERPMCIAGIFGGLDSGVKNETKAIFLEAAYFDSSTIRKTAKAHNLNTDSSFRFERGVDANAVISARNRAVDLILSIAGGTLTQLVENKNGSFDPANLNFDFNTCRKICGAPISNEQITKILEELDFEIKERSDESVNLIIPTYRVDVTREADVVEEILRIYGFNLVPIPEKLNSSIILNNRQTTDKVYNELANLLSNSGFYEIMNNSLTSSSLWHKIDATEIAKDKSVALLNPLSNELDILRQTLIIGGLQTIEHNQNRQNADLKLYEFGKVYSNQEGSFDEKQKLALFITGDKHEKNWNNISQVSNFYTLKGVVDKILQKIGVSTNYNYEKISLDFLEDGMAISVNQSSLVNLGWIKKSIISAFGVKNEVFYAEFDWNELMKIRTLSKTTFHPIPKTQFVRRDFSLLIDKSIKFEKLRALAFQTEKSLLKRVGLFDVYEGKNLATNKKSYALSFVFQDQEKTLQDKQVDEIMNKIRSNFEKEVGAELR